ncbi:hypothetical protein FRC17_005959, partial [Serendipita sp. 399]
MPREDSIGSSGGSITSDEEAPLPIVHPTVVPTGAGPSGFNSASPTVAGGTVRGPGIQRFQRSVRK